MAETAVASNNKSVTFRGKGENEMSSVSQAQNRFMHAAAEGKVEGVSPNVGKDFVKADHGRKIGNLPKHVRVPAGAAKKSKTRKTAKRAINRGMISEKAAKRHLADY